MKRKKILVGGIVIGVLILLFIIIGPMAPLWSRLGVEPFCIQGEWPHLQFVSCSVTSSTYPTVTPLAFSNQKGQPPIPVIVDDDGSPDGTIALLYFLRNPRFDVQAVTISNGEAHPDLFAEHILLLLAGLGRADIPVGAGKPIPLEGQNTFPDPWRQASDSFWDIELPPASINLEPVSAVELIVDTINNSSQPVLLFVSGTHTNLAEALQLDPKIEGNIRDVYIMGGSVYVAGNIKSDWPAIDNSVAEWNIWADPLAAEVVFTSGLPLHLIPLDATRKVSWTQSDLPGWILSKSPEGAMAGELLQWMLDSWSPSGVYVWDLAAAVQATNSTVCPEVRLAINIFTNPGPEQGRTVVTQGEPNVSVCFDPDIGQIKSLSTFILGHQ
jgi:purine nucleosidase/pyrimidine-specific ribonucleoside hydrolase